MTATTIQKHGLDRIYRQSSTILLTGATFTDTLNVKVFTWLEEQSAMAFTDLVEDCKQKQT